MFVIRDEQIQSFIAKTDDELVDVIKLALGETNPARISGIDPSVFGKMIKVGIDRARSHELSRAEDIAAFVAVMFEIAPNFDEQAQINDLLNHPKMTPTFRFYQIFEGIPDEAWEEAESNYNTETWFTASA